MSAEGAAGLLKQTLATVARRVDQEADSRGTLGSPEYIAFHSLVRSVYVGSLQKRAEAIESKKPQQARQEQNQPAGQHVEGARERKDETESRERGKKTRLLPRVVADTWADERISSRIPAALGKATSPRDDGENSGKHVSDLNANDTASVQNNDLKLGSAPANLQACSGDIAEALVAIAAGEGFEKFWAPSRGHTDEEAGGGQDPAGNLLTGTRGGQRVRGQDRRGGGGVGGGRGDGIDESEGFVENTGINDAQRTLMKSMDLASDAVALPSLSGGKSLGDAGKEPVTQLAIHDARFPGLEWMVPHIIGRSIPMPLRYLRCRLLVLSCVVR